LNFSRPAVGKRVQRGRKDELTEKLAEPSVVEETGLPKKPNK
jgi:hypothetical protein